MLENCIGKAVTAIKAYGVDRFDFTPNLLGDDFSVGEFGYTVFEFADSCFYISTDGISSMQPTRHDVKELEIPPNILATFAGAVLQSAYCTDDAYFLQFDGLDVLEGSFSLECGYTDRNYFDLSFPWF